MATAVVMPKLGNSVESSIIASWKKKKGDKVSAGEVLCEVETDKATMDIESPASGIVLELFFGEGDDVPVMTNIAAIGEAGEAGEAIDQLWPASARRPEATSSQAVKVELAEKSPTNGKQLAAVGQPPMERGERTSISPRARHL